MSSDFRDPNPYSSPYSPYAMQQPAGPPFSSGKVMAPAVALLAVGLLGLAVSLFNVVLAFNEPVIDPNAPQWIQDLQRGGRGPVAAGVQAAFAFVNLLIIGGSVQMIRLQTWGLAVTASVVAMLNFGSLCCVLGLPIGIWSIIVLMMDDVKAAFRSAA